MVMAGRGYLQDMLRRTQARNVGQVELSLARSRCRGSREWISRLVRHGLIAEDGQHLPQRSSSEHGQTRDQPSLSGIALGHHDVARSRRHGCSEAGSTPGTGRRRPSSASSPRSTMSAGIRIGSASAAATIAVAMPRSK